MHELTRRLLVASVAFDLTELSRATPDSRLHWEQALAADRAALEEHDHQYPLGSPRRLVPGDRVTTSGYPGTVIRRYSAGMVEVRLASGVCCVPDGDCVRAEGRAEG